MAVTIQPRVTPSGQGVLFACKDSATSNETFIETMTSGDEVQSITVLGNPSGGFFSLTFNGQTTAPIQAGPVPPTLCFQWNFTLPAPGTYDLAVNISPVANSNNTPAALYEIIDGGGVLPLATVTLNLANFSGNPATFTDNTLPLSVGGGAVAWTSLGTRTFTTTQASIRLSCARSATTNPNYGNFFEPTYMNADSVRVKPASGASYVVPPTSAAQFNGGGRSWSRVSTVQNYQVAPTTLGYWQAQGRGAGVQYVTSPTLVTARLTALSNIGTNEVACTGLGGFSPLDPVFITFGGTLGASAQNLLTCTDPNIKIDRVFAGGLLPTFKVNGVAVQAGAIGARQPYWGTGLYGSAGNRNDSNGIPLAHKSYLSTAFFPFLQDAPAQTFQSIKQQQSSTTGSWSLTSGVAGYTNLSYKSTDLSATAIYQQAPLKAGTYRVSATWPIDATFSTAVAYTVRNRAGATLGTMTASQRVVPSGTAYSGRVFQVIGTYTITGLSDDLVVTQSNGSTGPMIADTVLFERTSSDDSVKVAPGDVVTYSAGAGWLTTASGSAAAATDAAVANPAAPGDSTKIAPLYPPLPTTRTMDIGFGLGGDSYYASVHWYYNLAKEIKQFPLLAQDSDGYPTKIANSFSAVTWTQSAESVEADNRRWPGAPPGNYVVIWDGASNVTLSGTPNGTDSVAGTVNRKRYFRMDPSNRGYGPGDPIVTVFGTTQNSDSTWNCDVRNLRIFQILDGVNVDNPPYFHPGFLAKLQGLQCIRVMDPIGTNNNNPTIYSDFEFPITQLSRANPARNPSIPILKIEPYVTKSGEPARLWDPYEGFPVRITTIGNHEIGDGTFLYFDNVVDIGPFTVTTGPVNKPTETSINLRGKFGICKVLSATEIYYVYKAGTYDRTIPPPTTATTATLNGTARLVPFIGNTQPFGDFIRLANALSCDIHINIAHTATDDAVTRLGVYTAQNLHAGGKVHLAFGNEVWNFNFPSYSFCSRESYRLQIGSSDDYVPTYVQQAQRVWGLWAPAFAAANRPADLIRLIESQMGYPGGPTARLTQYLADHSVAFDELAVASYYHNQVSFTKNLVIEPTFNTLIDMFTAEQLIDLQEMMTVYGGWDQEVGQHIALMASHGQSAKIIFYEGGPEFLIPPPGTNNPTPARNGQRTHQVHRHPRWWNFMMHTFRMYQDSGCTLYNLYYLSGLDLPQPFYTSWGAYNSTAQLPYQPGNPAQDAIQINQYDRMDLIQSPTGGAVSAWAALPLAGTAPVNATGYTLTAAPTSVAVGSPVTITATLTGGATLASTLTITLADSLASTIGGTIAIANGQSTGTATITPTGTGTHAITGTHGTTGGFSGGDGSTSFAATSSVTPATGYSVTVSVANPPIGSTVTVTVTVTGGTGLSSPLVVTLADSAGGTFTPNPITIAPGSTGGTSVITPLSLGTHNLTATHSGGGFSGGDGFASFTAIGGLFRGVSARFAAFTRDFLRHG